MLDLLCTLLLAVPPGLADYEGARYVRWGCRHLQVGARRCSSSSVQAPLALGCRPTPSLRSL